MNINHPEQIFMYIFIHGGECREEPKGKPPNVCNSCGRPLHNNFQIL